MKKYSYSKPFSACLPLLRSICQKLDNSGCLWAVVCALGMLVLCCVASTIQTGYKAEAYVQPYSIKDNIIRMPRSHEQAVAHSQLRADTVPYAKGHTYRVEAAAGMTAAPPAIVPDSANNSCRQLLPGSRVRYEGKSIALPGVRYSITNLLPANPGKAAFMELLLEPGHAAPSYIQEANQCYPEQGEASLLVFSHQQAGSFREMRHSLQPAHYRTLAERYAQRYNLPPSLVMAIIKAESNFNPNAVSSQQALGLMQIVADTAGEEVYRYLNGYSSAPAAGTLLHPEKNILYGTTYLHLLNKRYFQGVSNQASRQLCIIAAYNGGPGAVLRVFDNGTGDAVSTINALSPDQVYNALTTGMPHAESRRYVDAVLSHIRNFSVQ